VSQGAMRLVSGVMRRVPRTHFYVDTFLDFVRRDPAASLAVLDGLLFGRIAPPVHDRRRLLQAALVVGHPSDPIHPFSDADRVARELVNARLVRARSIAEWRIHPGKLDRELLRFLDDVWVPASSRH